ncbi:MAG: HEPN domain-containing protein [Betaproteobacteria bacterium]|nr:HEPN domain-containing protein [Betaproteobacteria bacterium]
MADARLELAGWELSAAADELRSFAANVEAEVPRKALGSLYYAAFHLVQAMLVSRGVSAHTHNGVQIAFSLHFVKPGTVSKASAKLLSELQAVCERADYQVDLAYDASDVQRHLAIATPLIEELTRLAEATPGLGTQPLRKAWSGVLSLRRGTGARAGGGTRRGKTKRVR